MVSTPRRPPDREKGTFDMAYVDANPTNGKLPSSPRPYRPGELRVAVLRAVAAVRDYDEGKYSTQKAAVKAWRSSPMYFGAALAVLRANRSDMYWGVIFGTLPLLQTAAMLRTSAI